MFRVKVHDLTADFAEIECSIKQKENKEHTTDKQWKQINSDKSYVYTSGITVFFIICYVKW